MDTGVREVWLDIYALEREMGQAATYLQIKSEKFDRVTGITIPDITPYPVPRMIIGDETFAYTLLREGVQFTDFNSLDRIFIFSTSAVPIPDVGAKDRIQVGTRQYEFRKVITIGNGAGYIIHGRSIK